MNWSKDRVGGLILFCIFLLYGLQSRAIELLPIQETASLTARTVPYTLTLLGLTGSLWLIFKPANLNPPALAGLHWLRLGGFLMLMSMYGLALRPAGFLLASVAFLMCGFRLLGTSRLIPLTAIAIGIAGGFWLLMSYGLGVHLPALPAMGAP